MSAQFGGDVRAERIEQCNHERLKNGDCTFCKPHRGENAARSTNHRYADGVRVPRKGKDKK